MQEAQSMFLGGELVAATDEKIDHESSRTLGLRCPFCAAAVFYVSGSDRSRGTKKFPVRASFHHHRLAPDEDESSTCEARALTSEGRDYLTQLREAAKNQRLRLYNGNLWDIIAFEKKCPRNYKKLVKEHILPKENPEHFFARSMNRFRELWSPDAILAAAHQVVENMDRTSPKSDVVRFGSHKQNPDRKANPRIDAAMDRHAKIARDPLYWLIMKEVIEYLGGPTGAPVLENLVYLSLLDASAYAQSQGRKAHMKDVLNITVSLLAVTDWRAAVEHVRSKSGRGFGCR